MKGLDTRIAKLEKAAGLQDDVLCVILRSFRGELCGYRSASYGQASVETIRTPGETEAALLARAEAASPRNGSMIVLHEMRANTPNDKT